MKKITINGVEYPCYVTLGALMRFKSETGKDFSEVKRDEITLIIIFFWCCAMSACAREEKEFPFATPLAFADQLDESALESFLTGLNEGAETDESKKK